MTLLNTLRQTGHLWINPFTEQAEQMLKCPQGTKACVACASKHTQHRCVISFAARTTSALLGRPSVRPCGRSAGCVRGCPLGRPLDRTRRGPCCPEINCLEFSLANYVETQRKSYIPSSACVISSRMFLASGSILITG